MDIEEINKMNKAEFIKNIEKIIEINKKQRENKEMDKEKLEKYIEKLKNKASEKSVAKSPIDLQVEISANNIYYRGKINAYEEVLDVLKEVE